MQMRVHLHPVIIRCDRREWVHDMPKRNRLRAVVRLLGPDKRRLHLQRRGLPDAGQELQEHRVLRGCGRLLLPVQARAPGNEGLGRDCEVHRHPRMGHVWVRRPAPKHVDTGSLHDLGMCRLLLAKRRHQEAERGRGREGELLGHLLLQRDDLHHGRLR